MKILLLDCETSPNLVFTWGLWQQNVAINQIVDAGQTLCFAAKWYGKKDMIYSSVHKDGMKKMLKIAHKLLDEADVVVHYNGKKFDMPTLNKEFVKHNMLPPSPYAQVDLLTVARKQFRFASNKLDYVSQFLGLGAKVAHKGFQLWKDCMDGDDKAWAQMEKYNKGDVVILEKVYTKLLPWIPNHPNFSVHGEYDTPVCPNCGSVHVQRRGVSRTKTGIYHRFVCNSCGNWSRSRYTLVTAEQRENILV